LRETRGEWIRVGKGPRAAGSEDHFLYFYEGKRRAICDLLTSGRRKRMFPVCSDPLGRIAIVTDVGRNAMDAILSSDVRHDCGRQSRMVLAPPWLVLSLRVTSPQATVTKRSRTPGREHEGAVKTIAQGMFGAIRLNLW
jgi:hypothetical protein